VRGCLCLQGANLTTEFWSVPGVQPFNPENEPVRRSRIFSAAVVVACGVVRCEPVVSRVTFEGAVCGFVSLQFLVWLEEAMNLTDSKISKVCPVPCPHAPSCPACRLSLSVALLYVLHCGVFQLAPPPTHTHIPPAHTRTLQVYSISYGDDEDGVNLGYAQAGLRHPLEDGVHRHQWRAGGGEGVGVQSGA
jgi:hypothetical protein